MGSQKEYEERRRLERERRFAAERDRQAEADEMVRRFVCAAERIADALVGIEQNERPTQP